jgi:hypothetical protein
MHDLVELSHFQGVREASGEPVIRLALAALRPGIQLRLGEVQQSHIEALALSSDPWPPLLIRRADNTIVDGHYRYLAARQLGRTHIDCTYFDGGIADAYLEALRRNRQHGLPLSRQEREVSARHVLSLHPEWSDRRVAAACCVAPVTVARTRAVIETPNGRTDPAKGRVGKDGRCRPIDPKSSRDLIARELQTQPTLSLREIARRTGTSPATVRTVRARLQAWTSDKALVSGVGGTAFLAWFDRTNIGDEWPTYIEGIPVSRIYELADEARRRATGWLEFAALLEQRVRNPHPTICV